MNYGSIQDDDEDEKDNSSKNIANCICFNSKLKFPFVSIENLVTLRLNELLSYFRRFLLIILHLLNATAYLLLPIGFVYTVSVWTK